MCTQRWFLEIFYHTQFWKFIHLTDFSIGIKWYKNGIKFAMQMKNFCVLSAVSLRGCSIAQEVAAFIDCSKAEVHSCAEQPGIYIPHNLHEPRLFIDFLVFTYLFFNYQGSELSAVFQGYFKTVLH